MIDRPLNSHPVFRPTRSDSSCEINESLKDAIDESHQEVGGAISPLARFLER